MTTKQQLKQHKANAIRRLIEAAGGQSLLGEALGISRQHVQSFVQRGQVGRLWAAQIHRLDAARAHGFTREYLRPDVKPEGWDRIERGLDSEIMQRIDALNKRFFQFPETDQD